MRKIEEREKDLEGEKDRKDIDKKTRQEYLQSPGSWGYWLEARLRKTEDGKDFSQLLELGPVSHRHQLQKRLPLPWHFI